MIPLTSGLSLTRQHARSVSRQVLIFAAVAICVGLCAYAVVVFQRRANSNDSAFMELRENEPTGEDVVEFNNPSVAFLIGPLLKSGSERNPYRWFDRIQLQAGMKNATDFPRLPPKALTGRVSLSKGSNIVQGSGTRFMSQVDPGGPAPFNGVLYILDAGSTMQLTYVASVQSDTQLTLKTPWGFASVVNTIGSTDGVPPTGGGSSLLDVYLSRNYYDLALTLYVAYYRTGDVRYLNEARKVADSWWLSRPDEGRATDYNQTFTARGASLGGLMLRALDGRPEMWDWINRYTRFEFDSWIKLHLNEGLIDPREQGYLLLYAAWLAKVLPDSFPRTSGGTETGGAAMRAQYLTDAESAVLNLTGRLQYADGSYRWDNPYFTDLDGGTLVQVMQPFLVGIMLEGIVAVHQISTNAAVKQSAANQITKAANCLYNITYRRNEKVSDAPSLRWRSQWYFYYGGTTVNPTRYAKGGGSAVTGGAEKVKEERQLNSTVVHVFGYAYQITNDPIYRQMGDEMFDASYGEGVDGIHNLADSLYHTKDYTMNYRSAATYLARRLQGQPPTSSTRRAEPQPQQNRIDQISDCLNTAVELSKASGVDASQIKGLIQQTESAFEALNSDPKVNSRAAVLREVSAALEHMRKALAISGSSSQQKDAQLRLEWSAARLKRAVDATQVTDSRP
jgi:hypothetical protein